MLAVLNCGSCCLFCMLHRIVLFFLLASPTFRIATARIKKCYHGKQNKTAYTRYNTDVDHNAWQQQRIVCKLLSTYDSAIRPLGSQPHLDGGGPVMVYTSVNIAALSSFSDSLMQYTVQFRFRQQWKDDRLSFKNEHFSGSYVYLAEDQMIWNPDTFFQNEKSGHYHLIDRPNVFTRVRKDGLITYDRRLSMVFQCQMHLLTYPHDNQTCRMDFASYAYTTKDIRYVWHEHPITMNDQATSALPQFKMLDFGNYSCSSITTTGEYSCLRVEIRLLRVFSFFLLQLYIPSIMLVCVSYVSYWIDWRASPARVPLAIVTLLTMITQSHAVNSNLPPVSYTKAIDVWISGCIVFIFGSLIEYALVNYFGIKDERRRVKMFKRQQKRKREHNHGKAVDTQYPNSTNIPRTKRNAIMDAKLENNILRRRRPSLTLDEDADMDRYLYEMQRGMTTRNSIKMQPRTKSITHYNTGVAFMEEEANSPYYYSQSRKAESMRCCNSVQVLTRAERIDMISRIVFPVCFIGFNVVYWTIYTF